MTGLVEQEPYLKIKKLFDEKKFDDIIDYCQKLLVKDCLLYTSDAADE